MPTRPLPPPATAALVPIKAFADAKVRLAPALPAAARADLARRMAANVLRAARPLPVTVVCDDAAVAAWAHAAGADVLLCPGRGLNAAVADGVTHLARAGFDVVIVAHADLPLATGLAHLVEPDVVTLVPDRHDDGTNVLVVPSRSGFGFAYGPGSFHRHVSEAERLRLPYRIVRDRRLGWDVDLPDDLTLPGDLHPIA